MLKKLKIFPSAKRVYIYHGLIQQELIIVAKFHYRDVHVREEIQLVSIVFELNGG